MNPCPKNRMPIALLAVDGLEPVEARALRVHLETCAGCRAYASEIAKITADISALERGPELAASAAFHQRVTRALREEAGLSAPQNGSSPARERRFRWYLAAEGVLAVVLVWAWLGSRETPQERPRGNAPATLARGGGVNLDPTLSNYQSAANRSLDSLDDLLARQARQNPPSAPLYTASTVLRANGTD